MIFFYITDTFIMFKIKFVQIWQGMILETKIKKLVLKQILSGLLVQEP